MKKTSRGNSACGVALASVTNAPFSPRRNKNQRRNGSPTSGRGSPTSPPRQQHLSKKSRVVGPTPLTATVASRKFKKNNPVLHDSPMGKKDIYFALDCEMVGVGPGGLESALARVTIVNWDKEVVLDTFVKVPVPVTDYRTFVSGIKRADLESDKAVTLEDCRAMVLSILRGKILIGHGLENDLMALRINHPWFDIRDTATYAPYMREARDNVSGKFVLRSRKLRDLTWEKLGRQIQVEGKAHSPIEDAVAALDLYQASRNDWEMSMVKQINKARELETERIRLRSHALVASRLQQPMPWACNNGNASRSRANVDLMRCNIDRKPVGLRVVPPMNSPLQGQFHYPNAPRPMPTYNRFYYSARPANQHYQNHCPPSYAPNPSHSHQYLQSVVLPMKV